MNFVKVEDQSLLSQVLEMGKIPIWAGEKGLFEVLETETKEMNQQAKINIKACRDVTFSKPVKYVKKGSFVREFTNLSDFLLSVETSITNEDIFIVTSNDYAELFELIQQFINLGLDPNVYTEEDLVKKDTVSKFIPIIGEIKTHCQSIMEFLNNQNEDEFKNTKDFFSEKISEIEKALTTTINRTIKIAVFASKKTGKSMVVNCILGDEYAPTSLEIPTPNNIIYRPISNPTNQRDVVLFYDNREYKFKSSRETRRFLKDIFNEVSLSGKRIPDMVIEYPPKGEIFFEIIDTPGPDLAGSEHKNAIREMIKDTDIAVFIIDYSKYAQLSEIELFKDVKEYFESIKKQHSFICVINKYDLVFQDADTEKISVRVSDFIREKLKELQFNSFIVTPISALTWFYLNQINERFPKIKSKEDIRRYLEDEVESLIKSDDELLIPIAFIQNMANYIRTYFRIKPTYDSIKKISNFETFYKYLIDTANDKAKFEKIFSTIVIIESEMTAIENLIENIKKINLDKREMINGELENFRDKISIRIQDINQEVLEETDKIKYKFNNTVDYFQNELIEQIKGDFVEQINQEFANLRANIESDCELLKKGLISRDSFVNKYCNIKFYKNLRLSINLDLSLKFQSLKQGINETIKGINSSLDEFRNKINDDIKNLEENLNRKFGVNLEIRIPRVELSFNFATFIKIVSVLEEQIVTVEHKFDSSFFDSIIKGGFFRWLEHILFGEDRYEILIEKMLNEVGEIEKEVIKNFEQRFSGYKKIINVHLEDRKREFEENLKNEFNKIKHFVDSIVTPIGKIQEVLKEDIRKIEKIIEIIDKFSEIIKPLENIWNELLENYRALKSIK